MAGCCSRSLATCASSLRPRPSRTWTAAAKPASQKALPGQMGSRCMRWPLITAARLGSASEARKVTLIGLEDEDDGGSCCCTMCCAKVEIIGCGVDMVAVGDKAAAAAAVVYVASV